MDACRGHNQPIVEGVRLAYYKTGKCVVLLILVQNTRFGHTIIQEIEEKTSIITFPGITAGQLSCAGAIHDKFHQKLSLHSHFELHKKPIVVSGDDGKRNFSAKHAVRKKERT